MPRKLGKSWIAAYTDAVNKVSEAPLVFNLWAAISVIGSVLKNKVYIVNGTFKIYPNQYIVLVAPPGIGKGTAMHAAHAFAKGDPPIKKSLVNYMTDRITAPKIIERLETGWTTPTIINGQASTTKESSATLQSAELQTLISSSDWMMAFLCDAWDRNEYEYDTKSKGSAFVKNMCVSLIGGCVPDYIRRLNKDATAAISGGFTARALFVFASETSKTIPWPDDIKKLVNYEDFANDLEHISTLKGEFKVTKEAKDRYTQHVLHEIKVAESDSDVIRHFKARQKIHVLKLAMVLSCSSNDSLVISVHDMNNAIQFVNSVLKSLDLVFRGVGDSNLAEATSKIWSYIERHGTISHQSLVHDNWRHADIDSIEKIIRTLEMSGVVRRRNVAGRTFYDQVKNNPLSNKIKRGIP